MAQRVRVSLNPQHPHNKLDIAACVCDSSTGRDRWILGACRLASLAKMESIRFSERPCFKAIE